MSDLMKVYCINLDRRPDRLAHMTEQFERLGIDFIRVPAVDGQDPGVWTEAKKCGVGFVGKKMSDGAYACFQSHRKIWQMLIESGDGHAMVLEDDVLLSSGVEQYLSANWVPEDADLVKLETFEVRVHLSRNQCAVAGPRGLKRLASSHLGTGGYVFSKQAAITLLGETRAIDAPIDEFLFNQQSPFFSVLTTYQMTPAPVIQGDRAKQTTDWAQTSITERFAQGVTAPNILPETLVQRIQRRLREEIRALRQGSRYVVVPFG